MHAHQELETIASSTLTTDVIASSVPIIGTEPICAPAIRTRTMLPAEGSCWNAQLNENLRPALAHSRVYVGTLHHVDALERDRAYRIIRC